MKWLSILVTSGALLLGSSTALSMPEAPRARPTDVVDAIPAAADMPAFNALLLKIAREYPTDGTHGYWWPKAGEGSYDGSTRDVRAWGRLILRGEEQRRTYCCGLTLEVFMAAWERWVAENPDAAGALKATQFAQFKRQWFVLEINGLGPAEALVNHGLGRQLSESEVKAGDFVQLWRTNESGHSAIFLRWIRNPAGDVIGFNYWSSQESTNGIGLRSEYFDLPENREELEREGSTIHRPLMVRERVFFARAEPPTQRKPLRGAETP